MNKCLDCYKNVTKKAIRCHSCEGRRRYKLGIINMKGINNPNYKIGKCLIKKYCIECKKLLGKNATFYNSKRCASCNTKYLFKIGKLNQTGKKHSQYKDGRSVGKHYCIDCKKELSSYISKRCWKCYLKFHRGKNHLPKPKKLKLTKNTLVKHHINLNKKNNRKNNKLILTQSIHIKLHQWAYKYLVKKGLIRKYMKWFFKQKEIK